MVAALANVSIKCFVVIKTPLEIDVYLPVAALTCAVAARFTGALRAEPALALGIASAMERGEGNKLCDAKARLPCGPDVRDTRFDIAMHRTSRAFALQKQRGGREKSHAPRLTVDAHRAAVAFCYNQFRLRRFRPSG
jgi:hypothetical protein